MFSVSITFLFAPVSYKEKMTAARFKVIEVTSHKSSFYRILFIVVFRSVVTKSYKIRVLFMIGAIYARGISCREIS